MKKKKLHITTTIDNGKGREKDYVFEHRTVNWAIKEAKEMVMKMATMYAPRSKKHVYQSLSNNELTEYPYKIYIYSVRVRNGNIEKDFTFEYDLD